MATVHDVAAFIEGEQGKRLLRLQLQKLVYYAQAWNVAWDARPLFFEVIEGWRDGPVVRELRDERNAKGPDRLLGDPGALTPEEQEGVRAMLAYYGRLSEAELVALTHRDIPWIRSRRGLGPDDSGNRPIPVEDLLAHYGPTVQRGVRMIPDEVQKGLAFLLEMPEECVEDLGVADDVDGQAVLRWMETGEGNPWRAP